MCRPINIPSWHLVDRFSRKCIRPSLTFILVTGSKRKTEQKDDTAEKALKAQKRREVETVKKEKIKQKTVDTLLKKKDSKVAKQLKTVKSQQLDNVPKISYLRNGAGAFLSYPEHVDYPLKKQVAKSAPPPTLCCMCSNIKKYACSQTKRPLCSFECYKKNLSQSRTCA